VLFIVTTNFFARKNVPKAGAGVNIISFWVVT